MILQNEICHIEINIDETYTVDSVDNRHYDVTLNPEHYRHNDLSKTLSIHIGLYAREFQVALIGPYHSYECFFLRIPTVRKVCGGNQPATAGF